MLSSITIKNFALIDELSVDFHAGFSAVSGETGAGKSIIIDALRIALGERINSSMVRSGAAHCVIETVFTLEEDFLKANPDIQELISGEESFIINRTFSADGRGKIKVNGLNVTLAQLKGIGDRLVDFHGPHDHQALLQKDSHIGMLDRLSKLQESRDAYHTAYAQRATLLARLKEMGRDAQTREREIELLSHQIKELSGLELTRDKYEECLSEQARVNNTQELSGCIGQMLDILSESETSVVGGFMRAASLMRKLNRIDETTGDLAAELNAAHESTDSVVARLSEYVNSLEFEPEYAQRINATCDQYKDALRKYGPEIEDVAGFFDQAQARLTFLKDFDHNDKSLREDIARLEGQLNKIAAVLSEQRAKAAKALKKTIEKELVELGFAKVSFECRIVRVELKEDGFDDVEFYISPNPGEPLKPLADIVSGGESARIMLALKKALIKVDAVPVLIFDEIDAQIGGRLGTITGGKLKELSRQRQVLAITHLPQIASFADKHYKVFKALRKGRTLTAITRLEEEDRVKELAQMMGHEDSKASLDHAREMLAAAKS